MLHVCRTKHVMVTMNRFSGVAIFLLYIECGIVTSSIKEGTQSESLKHDEAWLSVNSTLPFPVQVYAQIDECWKCPLLYKDQVLRLSTKTFVVDTVFSTSIEFRKVLPGTDKEEVICRIHEDFREGGDYWIHHSYDEYRSGSCELLMSNNPLPAEMPIVYVSLGLLFLGVVYKVGSYVYNRRKGRHQITKDGLSTRSSDTDHSVVLTTLDMAVDVANDVEQKPESKNQRLKSLDAFRGISLTVMMFVNYGGGGYWFFEHPTWNGLTVADLVFPWFIFIMGTSMNYSFRSMGRRGVSKYRMLFKIIKRSAILFALGILLNTNWGPVDLRFLRILGVLQRFSLTYLVLGVIEMVFYRELNKQQDKCWWCISDVVLYLPQWLMCMALLALHLILTFLLSFPGCPTGYLGPGGLSDGGKYFNCTGGAAQYIDMSVVGSNHMYQGSSTKVMYENNVQFEPEGLLGTLTSIFLCFLGIQAGRIIMLHDSHSSRIIRWTAWTLITGTLATVLCKGTQNDGWIPVNKALWSVSYILMTGSFAFVVLALLYITMDIYCLWGGAPFIYPGMNSIVVYCCHGIFYRFFPVRWQIENIHWALLLQSVWSTSIWIILAYILYRKKIFIAL